MEDLDTVIGVYDVSFALAINANSRRMVKLARSASSRSPLGDKAASDIELLDAMVACIGDENVTCLAVNGDALLLQVLRILE